LNHDSRSKKSRY
jgi:hypothetical protein